MLQTDGDLMGNTRYTSQKTLRGKLKCQVMDDNKPGGGENAC